MGVVQFKMGIVQFKMGMVEFKMGIVQFKMGIVQFKMEKKYFINYFSNKIVNILLYKKILQVIN